MPKIEIPKRLRAEDYSNEYKALISKLSITFTPFMDSVYRVLNGGIDFENLNQQIDDVVIITDSAGLAINPPKIKKKVSGRIRGSIVVNAVNMLNPNVFPVSAPFVQTIDANDIITIQHVGGLQPNSQYRLTIQFIG